VVGGQKSLPLRHDRMAASLLGNKLLEVYVAFIFGKGGRHGLVL
jgi:hypothetical protein